MEYKEHKIADISVIKVPDCINYVADIKGSNKVMASSGSFKIEKYRKINCSVKVDSHVKLNYVHVKGVVDITLKKGLNGP